MAAKKTTSTRKPKLEDFETTIGEALKIAQALSVLSSTDKIRDGKTALRVGRMADKFLAESKAFEEKRQKLLKDLAFKEEVENEDGEMEATGNWKFKAGNDELFNDQINAMKDEPVKIVGVVKLEFSKIERTGLAPVFMAALDPIMIGQEEA